MTPTNRAEKPKQNNHSTGVALERLWATFLNQPFLAPLLAIDGQLACLTQKQTILAQIPILRLLDGNTGAELWQRPFPERLITGLTLARQPQARLLLSGAHQAPAAEEPTAVLLALDETGEIVWEWETTADQLSVPHVLADVACVTTDARELILCQLENGEVVRRFSLPATPSAAAPARGAEMLIVPCRGPHLLAVGWDGRERWHFTYPGRAWLDRTPLVSGDWVFTVRSNGALLALTQTEGELQWQTPVGPGKRLTAPVTDGQRIIVGAADGVYAYDMRAGQLAWYFATVRRVVADLTVRDDVVYVPCQDYHLYLLDAETGHEIGRFQAESQLDLPICFPDRTAAKPDQHFVAEQAGTVTACRRRRVPAPALALDLPDRPMLFRKIKAHFSMAELHTLCFDLNIDPENLRTTRKDDMIQDVIGVCERNGRLPDLIALCQTYRPHIPW